MPDDNRASSLGKTAVVSTLGGMAIGAILAEATLKGAVVGGVVGAIVGLDIGLIILSW